MIHPKALITKYHRNILTEYQFSFVGIFINLYFSSFKSYSIALLQMDKTSRNINQNIGSTLMVLQQQINHNKRLESIYSRTHSLKDFRSFKEDQLRRKQQHLKKNTKNSYQKQQHLKNIKHLLANITREKTMRERKKDENDFIAYPALFFRDVAIEIAPKKRKTLRRVTKNRATDASDQQDIAGSDNIVSIEKIRQNLPVLTDFDQSDLQQWADAVNRMIIGYNIMRKDELLSFAVKVLSLLPQSCHTQFKQAAEKWMDDICSQKVEVW